ncbi:HET domain protein [Xylaria bambusicola]|uniref:HET domain protein n=1 Tax=Xylaria bambusicola TaxID=326684 RepID=UPI0020080E81|nr:HET domain protein [Xylaria bambusicola]KAI0522107.1 HET domain protein [Xylaria bambusicola]
MRLINVESVTLEDFIVVTPGTLDYAILSHTWEDEEVTFQDFTSDSSHLNLKKGFRKILTTCEFAKRDGIKYAWVDTCCIDKTSSAELTEAINSMFNWYRDAKVCYAWLADLPGPSEQPIESSLGNCRWFTRGWTLQELIAPRRVEFYDRHWNFRGTKDELKGLIADVSHIGKAVLADPDDIYRVSIAQRMSWAANRQTTRPEDVAYCLIGIFGVNMPMLYGEGQRAFLRLQEEIVKETNDLSLFAWKATSADQRYRGIFARSPSEFHDCGAVTLIDDTMLSPEFSLGNKGLRIHTNLVTGTSGTYLLKLNCNKGPWMPPLSIWIYHHGNEVYSRCRAHEYGDNRKVDERPLHRKNMVILKQLDALRSADLEASHRHAFVFRKNFNTILATRFPEFPFAASPIEPHWRWDADRCMLNTRGVDEFNGLAYFWARPDATADVTLNEFTMAGEWFIIAFGKVGYEPWITVHGKDSKYGLKLLEVGGTNLERMGRMARESLSNPLSITLKNFAGEPLKIMTVSLNEGMLDGQEVYFIDIDIEDAPAPLSVTDEALRA